MILKKIFLQNKTLFENFIFLFILYGANYLLPLITLPYLVKVLGVKNFGLIVFAQSFMQYFTILTDYGFNLSATKEISVNRDNTQKISEIFNSVLLIKLFFVLLSFIIMNIIVFSFEKFHKNWLVYYLFFGTVVGQALFPTWFFQGIEKMKYITFFNLIAKVCFVVLVFIFIQKSSDYILVPFFYSLSYLVAAIIALIVLFKNFKVKIFFPKKEEIFYHLKTGGFIFLSRISISFYTISNVFFLGLLTNTTWVSYYSIAERIIGIVKNFNNILLQIMYPFIARLFRKNQKLALNYIKKEIVLSLILGLISSFLIFLLANPIISFFFGANFTTSVIILKILSITPVVILISSIIGQQIFLNFGLNKVFTLSIIYPSLLHLLILPILIKFFGILGAAFAVTFTESLILILRIFYLWKLRKDLLILIFRGGN